MFIQTLIAIAAISASAGTALAFAAVRYYQGKQPPMLPFSLFKAICRLDNSISVDVESSGTAPQQSWHIRMKMCATPIGANHWRAGTTDGLRWSGSRLTRKCMRSKNV